MSACAFPLRAFDQTPLSAAGIWIKPAAMRAKAAQLIRAFGVRLPLPEAPLAALSGGNIQRAILARELSDDVSVLIVANPCFGLDFTATVEIRARILADRDAGTAVLLLSEDLDEIRELADRILVVSGGHIAYEAPSESADLAEIGAAMAGH